MRPLPRYVLAIMAAFVTFELWIPLLAIVIRALMGPTVPTAVQAVIPLFGLAVPAVVGLALSDYLADRQGLVRPYQPKRRPTDLDHEDELDEEDEDAEALDDEDEETGDRGLGDRGEGPQEQGEGPQEQGEEAGRAEDGGQDELDHEEDRPARDRRQAAEDRAAERGGDHHTARRSRGPRRS